MRFSKTFKTKQDHQKGNTDGVSEFYTSSEYQIINNKSNTGYLLHVHRDGSQVKFAHVKPTSNGAILRILAPSEALCEAVDDAVK